MKNILLALTILLSTNAFAQDFIELTDGDTLHGAIWGVQPDHILFLHQDSKATKPSSVSMAMVKTYSRFGEIHIPEEEKTEEAKVLPPITQLQLAENDLHYAGGKLQSSATTFYVGAAFVAVGSILNIVGAVQASDGKDIGQTLLYVGSGTMAVGGIISFTAFIPIGKAGKTLQNIKLTK